MNESTQHVLTAKVAILEQVCLALLIDKAAKEPEPTEWATRFGNRFRDQVQQKADKLPGGSESDMASVVALEVLESFLDRLQGAVAKRQG